MSRCRPKIRISKSQSAFLAEGNFVTGPKRLILKFAIFSTRFDPFHT